MIAGCRLTNLIVFAAAIAAAYTAVGDDVLLKNKTVLHGRVDKDDATLRQISDGLKRIVIRDSKIEKITPGAVHPNPELFGIVQPIEVHAGSMPTAAIGVTASPWNEKGRRQFSYFGPRSRTPIAMTQAIIAIAPHIVRYRGIDGFWVGQVSTTQVPKSVIMGILGKIDRKQLNERQRIARFLLQAEWYAEAKTEVESIARDFPMERDRSNELLKSIQDLDARKQLMELSVLRRAQRPTELLTRLRSFPSENVAPDVLSDAREQLRKEEDLAAADRRLGESLRAVEGQLSSTVAKQWSKSIAEMLRELEKAPDAVRSRLDGFAKADPKASPENKLALALSGWIVGSEGATTNLSDASALWKARQMVVDYLRADDDSKRTELLNELQALEFSKTATKVDGKIDLDTLSKLVVLMPPALRDTGATEAGKPVTHRVGNDSNDVPTEYMVYLPPDYHPLRYYPTVVAIHDGRGPASAIEWWKTEAARRGYIVIAPEYLLAGQPRDYQFSDSEHAAIELSLRDARKRYSIDSDRVFLGGQVVGGTIALDFGFGHPDLFAGIVSISGQPAKYVYAYRKHAERLPLYIVTGELAPAAKEAVFDGFARQMISEALDVTFVEYFRRGLEDLPEEAPAAFEWMDKRKRDATPRTFDAYSARPSDARFYGVVIQELGEGRAIAPEAADALGKNIHPAKLTVRTSAPSNLLNITTNGVERLDVWISPKLIDFKRKLEVRINNRAFYKGPAKSDPAALLTDLRFRGDRQQLYWMKVSTSR